MAPRRPETTTLYVGYSTNVHPGENLRAVYRFLRTYTLPIKERVFGNKVSGLELHIGIGAARELQHRANREEFRQFLDTSGLLLFSVNAFPLLDFHTRRVKELVYKPSWTETSRAVWTGRIARIVADLLPDGVTGSISTLGGCFRPAAHGPSTFRKLAVNYLRALEVFRDLEERQGKSLVLAVEPEPESTFETTRDVVEFFDGYLLPLALERWGKGFTKKRIENDLRRLFTVNVDTCHLSVLFEDPRTSLRLLRRAGLRLGKIHVTNAVALRNPYRAPQGYADLRGMDEPRYFHQFAGCDASGRVVWRGLDLKDLPPELRRDRHPPVVELRSHFHVPLYRKRYRRLTTTQAESEQAVREILRHGDTSHLVIETYTWPILAGKERRPAKLISGICREYRWLLDVVESERGRWRVV